jgi:DNA polymerase III subunit beta
MTIQFLISQEQFQYAMTVVQRATATRVIQPILAHVLIEALDDQTLQFSATDLDIAIECRVPAEVKIPGKITIHAKKLLEIVSKLAKETVTLEADEQKQVAQIKCANTVFDVRTLPAEEYPLIKQLDQENALEIETKAFIHAVQHTVFATANYEANNVLGGVYFKLSQNELEMAATDGSRLARCVEPIDMHTNLSEPISAIIPARTLNEFLKLISSHSDETLKIALKEGQIAIRSSSFYLLSRLLDGQYPAYEQLIPKEYPNHAFANRKSLIHSLELASVMANDRTNIVKMVFENDNLSLVAQTPDVGDAKDHFNIEYLGEPLQIAFNYKFILDALKVIESDDVKMELNGPLAPTLFKPREENGFLCLVMPVQVK